jgi:hypothetical protein
MKHILLNYLIEKLTKTKTYNQHVSDYHCTNILLQLLSKQITGNYKKMNLIELITKKSEVLSEYAVKK